MNTKTRKDSRQVVRKILRIFANKRAEFAVRRHPIILFTPAPMRTRQKCRRRRGKKKNVKYE